MAAGQRTAALAFIIVTAGFAVVQPPHALAQAPVQTAPGVYAWIGDAGEIAPGNRGRIGNAGFIIGPRGTVVVDTGVSRRQGGELLRAIADVTDRPVELAVITHPAQEFLFGAAAFRELGIPLLAQRRTAELIRSRCELCLQNLRRTLGEGEMAGSQVIVPERIVEETTTLEVGGRSLQLLYFGWASTPGDLAVLDEQSGVLFAGGLVSIERVPELRDANIGGWIAALDRVAALPARLVVPGHGPVVPLERVRETRDYLTQLEEKVRALYKRGTSLVDAIAKAQLPGFQSWRMYAINHPQNVQRLYIQIENEDMSR
jgi:glyoxylase-like metal-dependent hydrolase (beta-lactamase superfamily II)